MLLLLLLLMIFFFVIFFSSSLQSKIYAYRALTFECYILPSLKNV